MIKQRLLKERSKKVYLIAIISILLVYTLLVSGTHYLLWKGTYQQLIQRDTRLLTMLAGINESNKDELTAPWLALYERNQSFDITRVTGVIAIQLGDSEGKPVQSLPSDYLPARLSQEDLIELKRQKSINRFHPKIWLDALFEAKQGYINDTSPLLEVIIPISSQRHEAPRYIQFWIDGTEASLRIRELNQQIITQILLLLVSGYIIITTIMFWAFTGIQKINRQLEDKADRLKKANEELLLAAKMSAIGSISTHLMHGIKSPVLGISDFIEDQLFKIQDKNVGTSEEWEAAKQSIHQAVSMVNNIAEILNDTRFAIDEAIEIEVLNQSLIAQFSQDDRSCIEIKSDSISTISLPIDKGNLITLILKNLLDNAIDASPKNTKALLTVTQEKEQIIYSIIDQGNGLPPMIARDPFSPHTSTKPNGSGIGLAISHHLAHQLNGKLTLEKTGVEGTTFRLAIPIGDVTHQSV